MEINEVIKVLKELIEDSTIPKNVKTKMETTMKALQGEGDKSIKISKALHELEGIGDDSNLQGFTRTQIFNVISMLSSLES